MMPEYKAFDQHTCEMCDVVNIDFHRQRVTVQNKNGNVCTHAHKDDVPNRLVLRPYTRKRDSNRNKIFVGDYVKVGTHSSIGVVVYNKDESQYSIKMILRAPGAPKIDVASLNSSRIEIIGNTFEHLLCETKFEIADCENCTLHGESETNQDTIVGKSGTVLEFGNGTAIANIKELNALLIKLEMGGFTVCQRNEFKPAGV